jgi:RNA-directed DNA polymerase
MKSNDESGREWTEQSDPKQAREERWEEWRLLHASPEVWTTRMLAGLHKGIKGNKWFSLADKVWRVSTLQAAFDRVKKNQGSAGSDGQTIAAFGANLEANCAKLSEELQSGRYQRQPVKRIMIQKTGGGERPLGIPAVRDRVVETAIRMVIEPIFDVDFSVHSHGFRPGRGCRSALSAVHHQLDSGKLWVVDADIRSYFDQIDHEILLSHVEAKISDGRVLKWLRDLLKTPIFEEYRSWTPEEGSPQGSVLSPLLANLYLDGLDKELEARGIAFARYADDFVLLCETRQEAEDGLQCVQEWCAANGLQLHPEKTRLLEVTAKEGFDFLGYHFRAANHWPSEKGRKNLRTKLRPKLKRNNGRSLEKTIELINPVLRGWFHYFKYCRRWQLEAVDQWVRMRLRSILRRRRKRKGRGRGADHQRWPNAHFEERGLFSLVKAHESFCKSHEVLPIWQGNH